MVGSLVGWLVGQLVSWSVGLLVSWSLGQLVSWSVGWPVGRLVGWLVGQAVTVGRSDRLLVIQDNVIVARNGVRGIVKNTWVEEVQIYVTCLILLAIDDVDAVPKQM